MERHDNRYRDHGHVDRETQPGEECWGELLSAQKGKVAASSRRGRTALVRAVIAGVRGHIVEEQRATEGALGIDETAVLIASAICLKI